MTPMKRYIFSTFILFTSLLAKAQPEVTLPYMRNVFQASFVNPTVMPEHTFSMGFSVFGQAISNGFQPKSFMNYRSDTMYVNLNSLLGDMNDKNLIYVGENVDIFHIRVKGKSSFTVCHASERNSNTPVSRDLFSLAIDGNKQFVGSTLDLSNLKSDVSVYNEYTIGYLKDLPQWTLQEG